MIIKIAVFCVAVSNCLQYVAIERQRQALKHANAAIKILAELIRLENSKLERK